MYFSSSGHKGYGGYDIFRSVYDSAAGEWSPPENLGYPVNTPDDEIFFQMSEDGRRGYFASVREGGVGFTDIFMIKYHGGRQQQEEPPTLLAEKQEEISDEVEKNAESGKFEAHELQVMAKNHKIYFNTDQTAIKEEHQLALDSIAGLIKKYNTLKIDISGFASPDGNPRYNLELSHKRALIVLDYFVRKGIDEEKIIARGFGAIDEDTTPELQRRADVRVVNSR